MPELTPTAELVLTTIIRELCIYYSLPKFFKEGLERVEEIMAQMIKDEKVIILLEDDYFKFAIKVDNEWREL